MSMKVSGNYNDSQTSYAERLKAEQSLDQTEKAGKTNKAQKDPEVADKIPVPRDEYTRSESFGEKPSGMYHLGQNEIGRAHV